MSHDDLNGCRVLIVEDEYFLADDLERALKTRGAKVIGPYSELQAAYRRAARDHFDVANIDINLHDEMAYPIADELSRQGIPFIFCSGYNAAAIPSRFAGVKLWQKPFDAAALVDDIRHLYRRRPEALD
jgi:DNA-binding response OmpR family regulator